MRIEVFTLQWERKIKDLNVLANPHTPSLPPRSELEWHSRGSTFYSMYTMNSVGSRLQSQVNSNFLHMEPSGGCQSESRGKRTLIILCPCAFLCKIDNKAMGSGDTKTLQRAV